MMPPPNITGTLHVGHALGATIQDILTRWKRMQGANAVWIPGTDHASIATEAKIVKALADEGLTKAVVGREGFLKRAWEWKEKYGNTIVDQQKKLGASCDWSRARFTMDPICSRAVREVFVRLFEKGLIYRGDRMVNWCTNCGTSLSDVEVEHEDEESALWYLRYPLTDGTGHVTVATTRPETMLGDTGVAVNPGDPRYAALVGKTLMLPIMNREIPVVADEHVDPTFGTGAVKVTPAHDPNDFEIGHRHGLESVCVIGPDGRMTEQAGDTQPDTRGVQARRGGPVRVGWTAGTVEKHTHAVGHCQRCGTLVEPVSLQWFVKNGAAGCWQLTETATSGSCPSASPKHISIGWRTCAIGASRVSCGGGTAYRCGTAITAAICLPHARMLQPVPSAAGVWNRTLTCSIHGSARRFGPSPQWAGRMKRRSWRPGIPRRCW